MWQSLRSEISGGSAGTIGDALMKQFEAQVATGRDQLVDMDRRLRRFPSVREAFMPTRTGNVLAAANEMPRRYGLDQYTLWPHLRMLIPDRARSEFDAAQLRLDVSLGAMIWGVAFCCLTPLAWWALPVGLATAIAAWLTIRSRAVVLADLAQVTWTLYRFTLYKQLGWPLPTGPAFERDSGYALSEYVARGFGSSMPSAFTFAETNEDQAP